MRYRASEERYSDGGAERTKVVELPQGAKAPALTDQPPKGPLMAVT